MQHEKPRGSPGTFKQRLSISSFRVQELNNEISIAVIIFELDTPALCAAAGEVKDSLCLSTADLTMVI